MAAGQYFIELKFRLFDGTEIGPQKYSPSTTVQSLKEKILAQWPKEKENGPRTINDLTLINAGKILENTGHLLIPEIQLVNSLEVSSLCTWLCALLLQTKRMIN